MKPTLQPGVTLTKSIVIDRARTIRFMGEDARVYATPSMILDMEHTCRELILQHADAGEDSVGIEVAVKHLAATLTGQTVEITAIKEGGNASSATRSPVGSAVVFALPGRAFIARTVGSTISFIARASSSDVSTGAGL